MMVEARGMEGGSKRIEEEMKEAEEEIEEDEAALGTSSDEPPHSGIPLEAIEEGGRTGGGRERAGSVGNGNGNGGGGKGKVGGFMEGARNFSSLVLGPVFVQAFVLTFLGEWGDRSQIATIALGAAHVRSFPFSLPFLPSFA